LTIKEGNKVYVIKDGINKGKIGIVIRCMERSKRIEEEKKDITILWVVEFEDGSRYPFEGKYLEVVDDSTA